MQDYFRKAFLALSKPGLSLLSDVLAVLSQFLVLGYLWFHPDFSFFALMNLLALEYVPSVILGLAGFQYSEMFSGNWKSFWHAHRSQGGWLLLTAVVQWWTNNLFTVASGVFIGVEALGAFRLVQSLFGILNMVFQTFENHLLPEASRLFKSSVEESKDFLRASFRQNGWPLVAVLVVLFIFSKEVMVLAGGSKFESYHMIIKGMTVLYGCILIGYPVRLAIRMMLLNQTFFIGYVLAFGFSLLSFRFLLEHFQLWGALAGLLINQLIMLIYWNKQLVSHQFNVWK
jgi:O-antigen/teichoic acid export membrane protein